MQQTVKFCFIILLLYGGGIKASHIQELGKYSSSEFDDLQPTFFFFLPFVYAFGVHVCTHRKRPNVEKIVSESFSITLPPYPLRQGLSIKLRLTDLKACSGDSLRLESAGTDVGSGGLNRIYQCLAMQADVNLITDPSLQSPSPALFVFIFYFESLDKFPRLTLHIIPLPRKQTVQQINKLLCYLTFSKDQVTSVYNHCIKTV